jgi:UPF0755 protein
VCGCLPDPGAPVAPGDDTPLVFEVPKGATARGLGPRLVDAGLVSNATWWSLRLRLSGAGGCVKAGKFEVRRSMSADELLDAFCGTPLADDVPFTVIEGWRIRDIDAALAAGGWIEAGAYTAVTTGKSVPLPFPIEGPTLEGYLYPETYRIPAGRIDVEDLVVRQLETFRERFLEKHPDGFGKRSLHQIVVVGSMLEREEPKPHNRPLVAGIMWKRLDIVTPLGIDATSRYTIADWNDRKAFLKQLRDPADPYNTRLRNGLPPTPIGNPAIASLEAAMKPEASEFLYYLHDAQQNLHPGRNLAEHEANRRKYDVW